MQPNGCMYVSLESEQVDLLRDVLRHALNELRVGSARVDSMAFRQLLHHREDVVAALLAKLSETERQAM